LVRAAGNAGVLATTVLSAGPALPGAAGAIVEGVVLGGYRFEEHLSKTKPRPLERVVIVGGAPAEVEAAAVKAEATVRARDWINEPPMVMTPSRLADIAVELGGEAGLEVEVWDEQRIASEGLGGLAGVSAGASEPPRLIRLVYQPDDAIGTLALVGKGITFDSGGLSLKSGDGMMTMKDDMGGAAAVLASMCAMPSLGVRVKVIGYLCATENMPSGTAIHPGDVLKARNGTTIEVLNTDAEGRLVLADGLSLAVEDGVDAIVDLATLTGAQGLALGSQIAAVCSNNDELCDQLVAAGDRAGEPYWRLPLWKGYRNLLDSEVADLKNVGPARNPGVITAALFLQEFVGDTPWAHLDIASPAWSEVSEGWITKGGTGWGVRTLLELVTNWAPL
jgi:leucyl aminopeptidase